MAGSKRKKSTGKDFEVVKAKKGRASRASAKQGLKIQKVEEVEKNKPKMVVSIDFGTTFSGAGFHKYADLESSNKSRADAIEVHNNWPGQGEAGARQYCKTHTSVWYMPGPEPGTYELKGWGWTGYVDYREQLQKVGSKTFLCSTKGPDSGHEQLRREKCGYFLTMFKLMLGGKHQNLPEGLTLERVISDFLRKLSTYVLLELRNLYGRDGLESHKNIQYVLTVPAMWTDRARQTMRECAETAGMVTGPGCKDNANASIHDLIIVSEPEAAAVQVHKTLETEKFSDGDRFLVADLGGGTTDIVVHEKIGSTTRRNIKVKEIAVSRGALVGGSDVDERFFEFLRNKIGCLKEFETRYPPQILEINRWWNDIKCSFDGSDRTFKMPIHGKLADLWRRFDRANGLPLRKRSRHSLTIESSDVQSIFDPVIDNILKVIHLHSVPDLKKILVVGGFSESPYLRERIKEDFGDKARFYLNGGSAVVRGAVAYGVAKEWRDMVNSRISARTIGYDTCVPFVSKKHRKDYMVRDLDEKMCDNIFKVIVRRGQEVPLNYSHKEIIYPIYRQGTEDSDKIEVKLYETRDKNPLYVTNKGVRHLATCCILVPKHRTGEQKLELSVQNLGTFLYVSVQGITFTGKRSTMPRVQMKWVPLNTSNTVSNAIVMHNARAPLNTCNAIVMHNERAALNTSYAILVQKQCPN